MKEERRESGRWWKGSKYEKSDEKVCATVDANVYNVEERYEEGGVDLGFVFVRLGKLGFDRSEGEEGRERWFEGEVKTRVWGLRGDQPCVAALGSLKSGEGDVLINASVVSRISTMRRSMRSAVSVSRTVVPCRVSYRRSRRSVKGVRGSD